MYGMFKEMYMREVVSVCVCTLITKQESESGTSREEEDRTSSIRKQNRDVFGVVFCRKRDKVKKEIEN